MPRLAMSTTLMPFLYQTRTIQRVARVSIHLARPTTSPLPSLRCALHTTARRGRDEIPWDLPPDVANNVSLPEADVEVNDTITPTERQTFEKIFHDIAARGKTPKLPKSAPAPDKDLQPSAEHSRLLAALRPEGPIEVPDPDKAGKAFDINSIFRDATRRYEQTQPGIPGLDPSSPLSVPYSATDREQALMRFPPTLRRAARTAYGLFDDVQSPITVNIDSSDDAQADAAEADAAESDTVEGAEAVMPGAERIEKMIEMDARRREEHLRIRALMDACADDFELWSVIEKEVLTFVGRLGITESPPVPPSPAPGKPKRGRPKKVQIEVQTEEQEQPVAMDAEQSPAAELDAEVYGSLYPQLLIEALNLLDTKFARPSPYAMHLLPSVKQLGLVSYVLGVSTSFYNRLTYMLWYRYGDATGVLNLLEEMGHAGLYFDESSRSLLSSIQHTYRQAEAGKMGHLHAKLMDMPEFQPLPNRLNYWISRIDRSIKERRRI